MPITQLQITNALERRDAESLPVFCIIKDKVKCMITRETSIVWRVVTSPRSQLEISRSDALGLIELCGLKEAMRDKKGSIYDTADSAFLRKYEGQGDNVRLSL